MKILALTRYGQLGASSRMRIYQYLPALQLMGINVQAFPLLRDEYIKRLYAKQAPDWAAIFNDYFIQTIRLLNANKFDLLWIEKELFPNLPAWFEQILSILGIGYIVDYDDAIFNNYDQNKNFFKRLLNRKIDKVMRNSSLVICGNYYLAERAYSANAKRVEIIPTVIDIDRYSVVLPKTSPKLIIGWVGSPSTMQYLDLMKPVLEKITLEFPLQLRVIGASFTSSTLDIDCRCWSEDSEVTEIQDIDIGIMPLIDAPLERGKCGYKLIQYMACGKPVVASPVGINSEIVKQGINGYLASTVDEWITAIRTLFFDKQLRLEMGIEGRKIVEKKYCLQVTAPRLAQLFYEIKN